MNLKPHEQKILKLFVDGLDPSAIAIKLECDKGYITSAMYRIRKKTQMNNQQLVLNFHKGVRSA